MKYILLLFVLIIGFPGLSQTLEGIWMGAYEYEFNFIKNPSDINYRRTAYLFDFYSDTEFLAYISHKEHTIFKFKKLRSGKYKARALHKKRLHFNIEIIDEERIKLYPAKSRKNVSVMILDKVSPVTMDLSYDSIQSILASSHWSLKRDYDEFTFEFMDMHENRMILARNGNVRKSMFGLVEYKGFFFFAFMDNLFFDGIIMQLNELNSNGFVFYKHNLDEFEDSKNASPITLKKENPYSKTEYDQFAQSLRGKWKTDVSDWQQYFIIYDDTTKANYLAEWLMVDCVLNNTYELDFQKDSSYTFINQGQFIKENEDFIQSDTISGKWLLSPTLKYIELLPDNTNFQEYEGTFIYIDSLDGNKAIFSFTAIYKTLFNNLTNHFEFEKVEEFGD